MKTVNIEKVSDKIRKLLALATSSNEAEAKSALMKARALMAEHKLSEADIADVKDQQVVEIDTGFTFSARRDLWLPRVCRVIAEHMCCTILSSRQTTQTSSVNVVGLEDDVALAVEAIKFAVNYVREQNKSTEKNMKRQKFSSRVIASHKLSYGYGFADGMKAAYEAGDQSEWGLVLQKPQAVEDFISDLDLEWRHIKSSTRLSNSAWNAGFTDGQNYKTPAGVLA